MKYYIIAGEASGDLHGSNLIKEIKLLDPGAQIRAWGGDLMASQGATLVKHINELAFMGFAEVVLNLKTILGNIRCCKQDILQFAPDVVIFIDYPGFNLRIAEFARNKGFRTVYYISPQIWAWHQSRVKKIIRDIDKMLVILPFEKAFYEKYNYPVAFVGHPLLDALQGYKSQETEDTFRQKNQLGSRPVVALLPGSRKQEIARMLAPMAKMVQHFPEYEFVIAATSAHSLEYYQQFIANTHIRIIYGQTYALLHHAAAALVTSGTATLETALIGTPQVVCYKAGTISYLIAKKLVKLKYISLVNLIMDKEVVKELIQGQLNEKTLKNELKQLLENSDYRNELIENYNTLRHMLGGYGASRKAASAIIDFLTS